MVPDNHTNRMTESTVRQKKEIDNELDNTEGNKVKLVQNQN